MLCVCKQLNLSQPDNVLYDPRTGSITYDATYSFVFFAPTPYSLIDFSHSISLAEVPGDDVGGVRKYMAPEVLRMERPLIGPASDVWSAGTVLAEWVPTLHSAHSALTRQNLRSAAAACLSVRATKRCW